MAFDKSLVQDVDQTTVEGSEVQYPLIQWSYGEPKLRKAGGVMGAGGWFISDTNMPGGIADELRAVMLKAGWSEDTITLADGKELPGLYIATMTFSLINMRKRWRASDGQRTFYYSFGWDSYEKAVKLHGRATSQIHAFVLIEGLEQFGPMVITLSGSAAMAFEGTKKVPGCLTKFSATVIAAANAVTKGQRWPYRAFWMTIAAAKDAKGSPLFTEVGSGENTKHVVLPVAKALPADPKQVDLDTYALNRQQFLQAQDLYTESVAWKAAWDHIDSEAPASPHEEYEIAKDAVEAAAADVGM